VVLRVSTLETLLEALGHEVARQIEGGRVCRHAADKYTVGVIIEGKSADATGLARLMIAVEHRCPNEIGVWNLTGTEMYGGHGIDLHDPHIVVKLTARVRSVIQRGGL
jgi:hypothetical protein